MPTLLSERLNELKMSRNLMQKAIADGIHVPLRTYQRYEYGEREPNASTLLALADYFDVSIDYLVGRTDNPKINR
ncbi:MULTISPECIES: helix-turn-helix domain-containing protein [Mitsuokella]|nr:helix-turn-helix transcriptional regulator [Mitsuokella multacida]